MKEKLYYIQNGYVGNAILWWGRNGEGYTVEIDKAGKYIKEETKNIIKRPEDKAWECSHVDNCLEAKKIIIDGQYLNTRYRLIGNKK